MQQWQMSALRFISDQREIADSVAGETPEDRCRLKIVVA
jgi:hypothetical protein